jgi:hypothetical protein
VTRLPTERLATACWATIVANRTAPEAASLLDFPSLQGSNKEKLFTDCSQVCSVPQMVDSVVASGLPEWVKPPLTEAILDGAAGNRRQPQIEVNGY